MIPKATNNRIDILTKYIFSCIIKLFSGDISENVILLATHANRYVRINMFKSKWNFKREIIWNFFGTSVVSSSQNKNNSSMGINYCKSRLKSEILVRNKLLISSSKSNDEKRLKD